MEDLLTVMNEQSKEQWTELTALRGSSVVVVEMPHLIQND